MRAAVQWLVLAGCAVVAANASAGQARVVDEPAAVAYADSGAVSRERIIEMVQRRYNARVVRVIEISVGGRPALELRLLSEQKVWNVRVDAVSGQVLQGSD